MIQLIIGNQGIVVQGTPMEAALYMAYNAAFNKTMTRQDYAAKVADIANQDLFNVYSGAIYHTPGDSEEGKDEEAN